MLCTKWVWIIFNIIFENIKYQICLLYCIDFFRLYRERITQVELKLAEVKVGKAQEYLQPLEELEDNMRIRIEVAGILRQYRLQNVNNQFDAEDQAAKQNFEVCYQIVLFLGILAEVINQNYFYSDLKKLVFYY